MTANSTIMCKHSVSFGCNVLMSWDILVMDTDTHHIYNGDSTEPCNPPAPIVIGNNVWIGCRSTILKGAVVPDGSVIAAGSLVTRQLDSTNSIIAGSPACVIRTGISWQP